MLDLIMNLLFTSKEASFKGIVYICRFRSSVYMVDPILNINIFTVVMIGWNELSRLVQVDDELSIALVVMTDIFL